MEGYGRYDIGWVNPCHYWCSFSAFYMFYIAHRSNTHWYRVDYNRRSRKTKLCLPISPTTVPATAVPSTAVSATKLFMPQLWRAIKLCASVQQMVL